MITSRRLLASMLCARPRVGATDLARNVATISPTSLSRPGTEPAPAARSSGECSSFSFRCEKGGGPPPEPISTQLLCDAHNTTFFPSEQPGRLMSCARFPRPSVRVGFLPKKKKKKKTNRPVHLRISHGSFRFSPSRALGHNSRKSGHSWRSVHSSAPAGHSTFRSTPAAVIMLISGTPGITSPSPEMRHRVHQLPTWHAIGGPTPTPALACKFEASRAAHALAPVLLP